jgi:hemolysin III
MDAQTARPLLRGVLHQGAFFVALVVGTLVIVGADGGRRTAAASIFAGTVALMLGASSLYHRITWSPRVRPWMRRVDHSGVYLLIAGTYTAVGLVALTGALQHVVLALVWTGVALAIVIKFAWAQAPQWLTVAIGLALGWISVVAFPQIVEHTGIAATTLLAAGGLAYTLGALIYAFRRPDPAPALFGYHELFHAFTLVAVACQYVAIAFFVLNVT